ncbi:hypothetical protein [Vibrio alginolyticus]|uniref:hypothetical protein n=1 Tax=Vibrio TaxID=662 RepID=UPI0006CA762C|nr:hypothetical protein [Vibrio alginolyticus]KPM98642.1 hypothetical protein AOG25_09420 [Vibrio alginolyticus]CAH7333740.1 conserved hypothetical protein [Vibrio chagasii]
MPYNKRICLIVAIMLGLSGCGDEVIEKIDGASNQAKSLTQEATEFFDKHQAELQSTLDDEQSKLTRVGIELKSAAGEAKDALLIERENLLASIDEKSDMMSELKERKLKRLEELSNTEKAE